MSQIAGISGSVTFSSGYTTLVSAWQATLTQLIQDDTPLNPTGSHRQYATADAIKGLQGRYSCRLSHACDSAVTSGPYGNEFAWTLNQTCDIVETTIFNTCWRQFEAGVIDTTAELQSVLDDTIALGNIGSTGTVELIQTTGTPNTSYSVPYVVETEESGVDVDGNNIITHGLQATAAPTVNNGLPEAGTSGTATFEAYTGREYGCEIIVTNVSVMVSIRDESTTIIIDFVADGEVTSA